jgi:uncharacterized protein DUF1330
MFKKSAAIAIAALAIGAVGGAYLHAQTATPPAYLIAHVQVTDPDGWKQYIAALPATLEPYHVKTLARASAVAVDASTPPARIQQHGRYKGVLEFAGLSGDHSAARKIRQDHRLCAPGPATTIGYETRRIQVLGKADATAGIS